MNITLYLQTERAFSHPDHQVDLTWQEILAEYFSESHEVENKKSVPLFNLLSFKKKDYDIGGFHLGEPNEVRYYYDDGVASVRRCAENVTEIHGLMLDVDEDYSIAEFKQLIDGLEFLLYTTHSHSAERDKFRVLIPFDKPMPADKFEGYKASIAATFKVDRASFALSQCFYLPSRRPGMPYVLERSHGALVDWQGFEWEEPYVAPPYVEEAPTDVDAQIADLYLGVIRQNIPRPDRTTWRQLACGLRHKLGEAAAKQLMQKHFPPETPGEYNEVYKSYSATKSAKFGSVVHLWRQYEHTMSPNDVAKLAELRGSSGAKYTPLQKAGYRKSKALQAVLENIERMKKK